MLWVVDLAVGHALRFEDIADGFGQRAGHGFIPFLLNKAFDFCSFVGVKEDFVIRFAVENDPLKDGAHKLGFNKKGSFQMCSQESRPGCEKNQFNCLVTTRAKKLNVCFYRV